MGEQTVSFSDFQFFSFPVRIGVMKIWHQHGAPKIPSPRPGYIRLLAETPPVAQSGTPAPRIWLGFSSGPDCPPRPTDAACNTLSPGNRFLPALYVVFRYVLSTT